MSWLIHHWLLTCCILILVFKDSQSLFLRHTKSGKCIAAGYLFWEDTRYAKRYWAEMVDNCLNVSAQFRYYNELLKNIETGGTFASNGGGRYNYRFILYKGKPNEGTFENSTENYLRQTPAGSLYRYNKNKCAEPSTSSKYVAEISGGCSDFAQQRFTFGSVTKFNAKMENVRCSSIQRMLIQKANYGDFDESGTFDFNAHIDTKCSSLTTCKVKNLCGGLTNKSCELTVSADLISPYCTDNSKELYTEYTCVNTYSFTITKAPKVKLSESPNKGVLQINDVGLTWRKVDDKNWDKDRQEMLCQHLGFEKTNENNLGTRSLGSNRNIATGDLVCYDTQSSGTSCCVHLQPSKTSKTIQIPYVTCKICDHPLDLPNKQEFPDAVFSGSGGYPQYHLARFNSAGWCSSTPKTSYLLIDLQKEYHITRIVIMGNKFQTKWSGSYSMKYSHDETLVDQSREIKITGNQNGFKASSTTPRNIFNVRYVKIQSTGTTEFCLRIEFCGNVQKPAAVSEISITPSNFSARVSWSLKSARFSSYITEFHIYLDGKYWKKINRIPGSPPNIHYFEIDKLLPNTHYTVGILSEDGFSKQGKYATKDFTTTEAVPTEPPTAVNFKSRSKNALEISWNDPSPDSYWNGVLIGYRACISTSEALLKCSFTESKTHTFDKLTHSTKYFVSVAAGTSAGYGVKSSKKSKITNGDAVKPVATSYSSLRIDITRQKQYIKEVMIIVQPATKNPKSTESIHSAWLRPYATKRHAYYVAAYLAVSDEQSTFVIGDGSEYDYKNKKYFNQPLRQNTSYNVFLRFFENKDSYYSTQWSESVRTMIKPPAPIISKPISIGPKKYQISWSQPSLPEGQTVVTYHLNYSSSGGSGEVSSSTKKTIYSITVDNDKFYTFEVEVETEAGRSNMSSISWQSNSAPSEVQNTSDGNYIVKLNKPGEDQEIKTVALVLLQLKSESSEVPSPDNVKVKTSAPKNNEESSAVAYIAKEFNITEFNGNTIEVILRVRKDNRRRKRNVAVELQSNTIYRSAQMNTDASGNRQITTYWSTPIKTAGASGVDGGGNNGGDDGNGGNGGNDGGRKQPGDGEDSGGGTPAAAVGASVGVVVVVVAVVIVVAIFLRRRKNLKRKPESEIVHSDEFDEMKALENNANDGQNGGKNGGKIGDRPMNECIYSNETEMADEKTHASVPVDEFAHYVNEMKAKDNGEFKSEYADLPKNMETSWEVSKKPFNKKKNRYGNIVTYDYCRVVLSGDEKEDYINASFIDGIKTNAYIASQGPNKSTVNDMWRMVWEQRSYSIVMVTSLVELGKPKCEKYWPDKGTVNYGDIEVTLVKTEEFAYHVTHTLQIKKDGEEREVKHYYFFSWPDHGVPKYPTQLLAFRRHFRTNHLEQSGPVVVHCSAGVGRTGVFLAIDMILEKLEKGLINSIDVFGQVCAMRERRMNMIQTMEQYIFVHEAILETILCGMNEVDSTRIQKETENLAQVKASGMTGFEEKFRRLGEVSPVLSPDECAAALLEGNDNKNRNKNVYPAECNRVPLQYVDGVSDSDYINAVFVHGYLGRNYFIATQSPLPNTINDFWRMVQMHKSSTIVLLNNLKDGTSFPKFWPTSRGKPVQYDKLTVQLDSEAENDDIWTRKLILSPYPDLTDGHVVNIFHYTKWPDHRVPTSANSVITLTSLVEKSRQSHGQGPVIVACSDGAGRTGAYIAISNLLERMKIEQAVDVFQSIKIIRGTRPQFVETAEQYQFCYTAMMAYLDAFSDYSNFD